MDLNNLRPAAPGGEAPVEQVDWRTQLQTNIRQSIVHKIMRTLKGCLPASGPEGLQEFTRVAMRFEEEIYTTASSQSDYLEKISLKMVTMENNSQNPNTGPANPASNSNGNSNRLPDTGASLSLPCSVQIPPQAHQQLVSQGVQNIIAPGGVLGTAGLNSNMQNMPIISQAFGGNQTEPSNVFSGSQGQMLGRQVVPPQQQQQAQSSQYHYQQQQLLKPKFQHGTSSHPLVQSHIPQQANQMQSSQQYSMQNSGVVQPSFMQLASMNGLQQNPATIQHSTSSMLQLNQQQFVPRQQQAAVVPQVQSHMMQQQLMGHQANPDNLQQNQLMGQKQKLMAQQYNLSNSHQQQLGAQNNVGLQQQQLLGSQSAYSGMPTDQRSVYMLEQPKVPTQQQPQPGGTRWLASQGQQSQSQAPQKQSLSRMQSSPAQLQHQLNLHQQSNSLQLNLEQRVQGPGQATASLDPAAQSGQVNGGDWLEESYQKVKQMRDNFLPELTELYQKVVTKLQQHDSIPQQPKSDQLDNLKLLKRFVEYSLRALQMPKSGITPAFMEKLASYENQIQSFLCSNRPRRPMQQGLTQPHMQSFQPGSGMDPGQGSSVGSLQQVAVGSLQQNSVSTSQQPRSSFSSQSGVSVMQPNNLVQSNNPVQSNSNMLQHQHLKQQEQQVPQAQQLKQQFQQQCHMHSMNDANEMKVRKGMKSGVYQQNPTAGQHASYPHQQIKSGTTFPTTSSLMPPAASPQLPQHSSVQFDQQSILSSSTKTGTPLQHASSPFIVPSPMPGKSEKPLSPSLSNVSDQQTLASPSLAVSTPGISASPLLAEFTGADGDHGGALIKIQGKPNVLEQPLEHLLKVVESLSPKALSDSISDLSSVVSMIDRTAGSSPTDGYRTAVGEDLVAMTKCCLQASNIVTQDGLTGTRKMKRCTSGMPMNVSVSSVGSISDSFKQLTGSEAMGLESTATSRVKRRRMEANRMLMEEIREINQRLMNTVVEISNDDTDPMTANATAKSGEGIMVKCSYRTVALSPDLKSQYAHMSPIQPLGLIVPANYPNSSPMLLDKFLVEASNDYEDLSAKVKSRFSIYFRSLSPPISLGEIARIWDICTRDVVCEYAQQSGGGTFSSTYGAWEICSSAA